MTIIYYDGKTLGVDRTVIVSTSFTHNLQKIVDHSDTARKLVNDLMTDNPILTKLSCETGVRTDGTKMVVHRKRIYCDGDRIYASATTGNLNINNLFRILPSGGDYLDAIKEQVAICDTTTFKDMDDPLTDNIVTFAIGEKYTHVFSIGYPVYYTDGTLIRLSRYTHNKYMAGQPMSSIHGNISESNSIFISHEGPIPTDTFMEMYRDRIGNPYTRYDLWSKENGYTQHDVSVLQSEDAFRYLLMRILVKADLLDKVASIKVKYKDQQEKIIEALKDIDSLE